MKQRTLYLAWRDSWKTRAWFPVGRLDVSMEMPQYRFRHVKGAEQARETGGFDVVPGFADLYEDLVWPPISLDTRLGQTEPRRRRS